MHVFLFPKTIMHALEHCTMASSSSSCLLLVLFFSAVVAASVAQDASQLTLDYYAKTCPSAQEIVRSEMECAVSSDPRMAAAILRLHFHDCFVQGCDGSVLLDNTYTIKGEKEASQSKDSLIGFELVDRIKTQLESECPGIVSCADLLTIAARDAVILVGGPYWHVPLGRKDSKTASLELANSEVPTPDQGLVTLITKFLAKGLSVTDMVALSGAHTIGMARCTNFRSRIYGDFHYTSNNGPFSAAYLEKLKSICPDVGNDDSITAMDYPTPTLFDNSYYATLLRGEGLLNSDQELYTSILGFETKGLVKKYAADPLAFFQQFSDSMVKMGNITNPEGGEVRTNCRFVNT